MKTSGIAILIHLAVAASLYAQRPAKTVMDGAGNKLTYVDGITSVDAEGKTRTLSASESIMEPPKSIPDNCSILDVISVTTHGHSDAYNLLGFSIAAMEAGHQAEGFNAIAVKSMKLDSGDNPTVMLTDVFQNFDSATNKYLCGAFIEGQYQATDENRKIDRATIISIYNRLAVINGRMKVYVEAQFRNVGAESTRDPVDNAILLSKITNDRQAALADLVSATSFSALLSIYIGDPSEPVADTLDMSSAERKQLLDQLDGILNKGSSDGFTQAAGLLKEFLSKHPKVRN